MRMKFILALSVLSATALSSISVKAASPFSWPPHHHNFLLGGELGYSSQKQDFITRFTGPGLTPPLNFYATNSEMITNNGMLMGFLAGWQWRTHRWMLGAEANVDFDVDTQKNIQFAYVEGQVPQAGPTFSLPISGAIRYERGNIYALTARSGYFVTPFFMPYVRLGAQISRDEVSYQVSAGVPALSDFSSRKKDVYGVVAGLGAEFPTYIGSSTVRVEYTFVRTESVIIEDNTLPIIGNHKFRYPESHIGKIAWVWNFL